MLRLYYYCYFWPGFRINKNPTEVQIKTALALLLFRFE